MARVNGTTHAEVIALFSRLLPESTSIASVPSRLGSRGNTGHQVQSDASDALLYHLPVHPSQALAYSPTNHGTAKLILSLTATRSIYDLSSSIRSQRRGRHASSAVVFLHRPWDLDRSRLSHGTLVLQSHVCFDEIYTTGFNEAFAKGHFMDFESALCLKGYKGDPDRKIGIIASLSHLNAEIAGSWGSFNPSLSPVWTAATYATLLSQSFHGHETTELHGDPDRPISTVASLNAFTPEIVSRVLGAARVLTNARKVSMGPETGTTTSALPIPPSEPGLDGSNILILTGAAKGREDGMQAAKDAGIAVVAVGHRRSEMWGLRYLAERAQEEFRGRGVEVYIVDEEAEEEKMALERKERNMQRRDLQRAKGLGLGRGNAK